MGILGVGALLLFGPEQLPVIFKKAGRVMRDVQNTSQSFIREMERAADEPEVRFARSGSDDSECSGQETSS